ncbi:MAG TPA: transcription termination/antitermination NusG family protein [Pyrinomonadaceae bacterium]|jgi:transcriptional antiterminator RfaH
MKSDYISETPYWYAIHTKPRQEERAACNLIAWEVETFSPRLKESRRNTFTGQPMQLVKPLFPGYIFAKFDARTMLHKVCFTRGVHSVVSFGGSPVPVSDEIISLIRSQIGADGFVKLGGDLDVGDEVRIKDGPLQNFVGVFERKINATNRVMLLLRTVNYQGRVEVDLALLEKIS